MSEEIYIPRMGSTTMESATILEWLVAVGDTVEKDQILLEIETDKTNVEVPSPAAGVILDITSEVGDEVEVGAVIGHIGEPGELVTGAVGTAPAAEPSAAEPVPVTEAAAATVTGWPGTAASPAARRRARELGVDLASLTPGGPGTRISVSDVEQAAAGQAASAPAVDVGPTDRTRAAALVTKASQETAPVTLTRLVDASGLVAARERDRATDGGPAILDRLIAAVAGLLPRHPQVNSTFVDGKRQPQQSVSVGFAVQTDTHLQVPVLRDTSADAVQVAARRRALTQRALSGALAHDDVTGGTFTVSNLGGHGVDAFTPIISVPQVAILGVGRTHDAVLARDGAAVVAPVLWLSLTFDHRALDGAAAGLFLSELATTLEQVG